jgi:peroxiredoxin
MAAIGDTLPDATFLTLGEDGVKRLSTADVFGGRTVLAVGVVGAFTPVCDRKHLPEFIPYQKELAENGLVDDVVCIAAGVDPFVMNAWAKSLGIEDGGIQMLTDKGARFVTAMGLAVDLDETAGLGVRSQRYVLVARDGVISILNVETAPMNTDATNVAAVRRLLVGA